MKLMKKYSEMNNEGDLHKNKKNPQISKEFYKILEQESEFDFQAIEYREKIGLLISKIARLRRQ